MDPVNPSDHEHLLSNRTRAGRWDVDFPFEWDADELVSRRQLLQWSVGASGALFAATAILAALAHVRRSGPSRLRPIVQASALGAGEAHYFTYPGPREHAILLRLATGRLVAYRGTCTHLSCAVYWNRMMGKLRCPCHEGLFDPETGGVLAGPPPRPLPPIPVHEEHGMIYAVEDEPR